MNGMNRRTQTERKTSETEIVLDMELDSDQESQIDSGVPFFNHMLSHIAKHGRVYLNLKAMGDWEVDDHHTVEDIGIVMGQTLKKILGDRAGIYRYGHFTLPMDESLVQVALDFSNRSHLIYHAPFGREKIGKFDVQLIKEFFIALSMHAGITLHIRVIHGENLHHIAEAIFKCFGHALRQAVSIDPSRQGILSTKGML